MNKKLFNLCLLNIFLLNLIFRYPNIPHEQGTDSLEYHAISYYLNDFGVMPWYTTLISAFGLGEHTQEIGFIALLSSASLVSSLTIEYTILFFSIFISINVKKFLYQN